jgi:fluoride exporter
MNHVLAVALGGAIGSVLRFGLSHAVQALAGRHFPSGTLVVNVVGCLLMGFLFVCSERGDAVLRTGVLVGVLGGFTTFSAFSIETWGLLQQGAWFRAGAYILLSVVLCIAATWFGVRLGRHW